MYCTQQVTTTLGSVNFGFVSLNNEIHVKLLSAHLTAAPERFSDIQDIRLLPAHKDNPENIFVIPVFTHKYFDDFAKLVHSASKQIDWQEVEQNLYAVNVRELDAEIKKVQNTVRQAQDRLTKLQNSKDVAQDKAERGLLRQAMSYLQSVIFGLPK